MHEGTPHDTYDLGYGDISGAYGGNVQSVGNIMEYIFNTLQTAGYEEFQGYGFGSDFTSGTPGQGGWSFGGTAEEQGYDLQGWQDWLGGESFQEGSTTTSENQKKMAQRFLSVLSKLNIPGLMQTYGQDVGDVGAEIGSQTSLLKKALTTVGKGGRYGALGTGGKLIGGGGGRQDFLSDYYGLQEKQGEMTTGLQTGVEEDINRMMIDYMGLHPSVT